MRGAPPGGMNRKSPGAPREDYFETLADPERRATLEDETAAREFYLRHDTYWT